MRRHSHFSCGAGMRLLAATHTAVQLAALAGLSAALVEAVADAGMDHNGGFRPSGPFCASACLSTRILGKTIRDAVRNKEWWKRPYAYAGS